jgi:hypothetical protein
MTPNQRPKFENVVCKMVGGIALSPTQHLAHAKTEAPERSPSPNVCVETFFAE